MENHTFILLNKRTYKRTVKLYLKDAQGKVSRRNIPFTTSQLVSDKNRTNVARTVNAAFTTNDETVYDAMLRDSGYGKTFILKSDPKAELKRDSFNVTHLDAKKAAMKNLFDLAGMEFDGRKDSAVLEQEYAIHMAAKAGVNKIQPQASTANEVKFENTDVYQDMINRAQAARDTYKKNYGEDIPDAFSNDMALLAALETDPSFDAKSYMAAKMKEMVKKEAEPVKEPEAEKPKAPEKPEATESIEDLRKAYFDKFSTNVPTSMKNNAAWIKGKLEA